MKGDLMKKNLHCLPALVAIAVLAIGPVAIAGATEGEVAAKAGMKAEATLTGQLSKNADDQFVLTEAESGDTILLAAAADTVMLADHVGHEVNVTGTWSEDKKSFTVSKVEAAPAEDNY
jgi:hypothetical protein